MSHFNQEAENWDKPEKVKLMAELAQKVVEALNLNSQDKLQILDFGCGTGLFGLELGDYAESLLGIDTSEGMLEVFNRKVQGTPNFRSANIDLEKENIDEKFDLIISSMAFHHLVSPIKTLEKLAGMLNENGRIAIVDLDKEDGSFHPDPSAMGVRHFGFSKEDVLAWGDSLGLNTSWSLVHQVSKNDKSYGQFLAIFQKN